MPEAFIVVWDPTDLQNQVHRVESYDWHVCGTESRDPEDAASKAAQTDPDAVLIWLDTGYPRSRRAALHIKTRGATQDMPIVFVNGSSQEQAKMRDVLPAAIYTDTYHLELALREAQKAAKNAGKEAKKAEKREEAESAAAS